MPRTPSLRQLTRQAARFALANIFATLFATAAIADAAETLWVATPLTQPGEFTDGIEGPACDPQGNVFAVNYRKQGTIGRVTPEGQGEVFVELPKGSIGNGIRFNAAGNFLVADYTAHQILEVNPATRKVNVLAHNPAMNQPNDIAIADDGTLTHVADEWTRGNYPRSFNFDPTGNFLYCCNQRGDNVATFKVDRETGMLAFTGQYTPVGNPSIIVFLELNRTD